MDIHTIILADRCFIIICSMASEEAKKMPECYYVMDSRSLVPRMNVRAYRLKGYRPLIES